MVSVLDKRMSLRMVENLGGLLIETSVPRIRHWSKSGQRSRVSPEIVGVLNDELVEHWGSEGMYFLPILFSAYFE